MEKEKTCKERVRSHYRGRMSDIRKLWKLYRESSSEESDPDLGPWEEYGLCLDYVEPEDGKRGFIRFQLSTGGPGDEFRFFMDERLNPIKIEYWFLDWWDGAKVTAQGHNLELLKEIFADWKECDVIQGKIKAAAS